MWKNVLIVIFAAVIISVFIYKSQKVYTNQVNTIEFNGIVEHVRFGEKGFPIIRVSRCNEELYLSFANKGTRIQIEVGDSIFKEKGSSDVFQYRNFQLLTVYQW